jgi:hypothetical protein
VPGARAGVGNFGAEEDPRGTRSPTLDLPMGLGMEYPIRLAMARPISSGEPLVAGAGMSSSLAQLLVRPNPLTPPGEPGDLPPMGRGGFRKRGLDGSAEARR